MDQYFNQQFVIAQSPMIQSAQKQIKTVRCPYMPEHIMPQASLLNHLSKCSANNKNLFTKCRYNPLHVYPKDNIQNHYQKCKDKLKYQKQNSQSSDNWDSDNQQKLKQTTPPINTRISQNSRIQTQQPQLLNQSTIQKKGAYSSDSDEWNQIVSDEESNVSKQQKQLNQNLSHLSIQSNQTFSNSQSKHYNRQNPPSKSNPSQIHLSSNSKGKVQQSKLNSSLNKQAIGTQSKSFQLSGLNSDSFSYQGVNNEQKDEGNKNYETLRSISEGQENRDNPKSNETKIISLNKSEEDLQVDDF